MQNTENFNLKIYEGEDLFNPLTVENVNTQAIDTQMKKNENHAVGDATELVSGTVHAITRLTPDAPMLRFTATSRFTSGDTFTVDGVQVSALTVSGEQLPDGAYIIGSEVLAYLKGTLLTVFTSQGTLATAKNALKLGGNDPEYYATASAVQTAQETATAAGNLANEVNNSLEEYKISGLEFVTSHLVDDSSLQIYFRKQGKKVSLFFTGKTAGEFSSKKEYVLISLKNKKDCPIIRSITTVWCGQGTTQLDICKCYMNVNDSGVYVIPNVTLPAGTYIQGQLEFIVA